MMRNRESRRRIGEERFNELLAEKMEWEYRFQELESSYRHEREQREEILRLHENTRRLKHDMKNHIMMVTTYLQENQVEEAKGYLSHVLEELNHIYTDVETGNSVMNYVLNWKLEAAYARGLCVRAEIENLAFGKMDSVDFVSLLSNLLDNAIEGAVAREGEEEPEIVVKIALRRGYETIQVKNSIARSVLEKNPQLKSEKAGEEHGYGVGQIRQIIGKYGGECQFFEKDEMFCAVALIPSE